MLVSQNIFEILLLMQRDVISEPRNLVDQLTTCRPLKYERVYLPLFKVADKPFHI